MLVKLQLLYPSLQPEVLSLIIESAEQFVVDYCGLSAYSNTFDGVVFRMCQEDINSLYAEGYTSESLEGSSVSYTNDYSSRIYKALNKHKHVRTA